MSKDYNVPSTPTTLVHAHAYKMHIFEEVHFFLNRLLHILKNVYLSCMRMHKGGSPLWHLVVRGHINKS